MPEWFVCDRSEPQGEDCLVLNVWTPALDDGRKRPVMVWLHGGGFADGSSVVAGLRRRQPRARRATWWSSASIIGSTCFGFLHLGEHRRRAYADSGNAGMLDIVAALEWVRDNIARSAATRATSRSSASRAAAARSARCSAMPAAKGLFHKAIAMSGSQVRSLTREQASGHERRGVLAAFDIARIRLDELHTLPMRQLREVLNGGRTASAFGWGPWSMAGRCRRTPSIPRPAAIGRRRAAHDRIHRDRSRRGTSRRSTIRSPMRNCARTSCAPRAPTPPARIG